MGPLPQLYKVLVAVLLLVLCLAGGLWLAGYLRLPLSGFGVGIGVGVLLTWLMTRDFGRRRRRPVQRRR